MIVELPKLTQELYNKRKEDFYKKPGIPDIELELEEYQKELLLKGNFGILPIMHTRLAVYAKSLLLKELKGTSDFIEEDKVEELVDVAASNFIKRYFRIPEPVVGASFAGILQYKVREVLSNYFKGIGLESNVSIDTGIGEEDNVAMTVEQLLAFKAFTKNARDNLHNDLDDYLDIIYERLEKELALLREIRIEKNLDKLFLQYLTYLCILQSSRLDRRLTVVSAQALKLVASSSEQLAKVTPILESALLDISEGNLL